ncbi:MAG: hypothetical protein AAGC72_12430 [Planctomycetota bacterium]
MPSGEKTSLKSIELITPAVPPVHDAIGEYTEKLAVALAPFANPTVLTGDQAVVETDPSAPVEQAFSLGGTGLQRLAERLEATKADAVVLQYNPFGWGRRGWAPGLVSAMRRLKKQRDDVLLSVMFHETYVMNKGWKAWVMRRHQLPQFHALIDLADVCFFSTENWADQQQRRRPEKMIEHLPVGSNLRRSEAVRSETRKRLGIAADALVVGAFGGQHPSRPFDWIRSGAERIAATAKDRSVVLLHVGGRGDEVPPGPTRLLATGRLPESEAADVIAIMDVMLNPFIDGLSTRRGSAIAALQHGVPVVSTMGHATDRLWRSESSLGVFLTDKVEEGAWLAAVDACLKQLQRDPESCGSAALRLFEENLSWPVIATRLCSKLVEAAKP